MRRLTRIGLAAILLLLVVVFGGYTAIWFYAAHRVPGGLEAWTQSMRARHLDLTWQAVHVGGYPFAFRIKLDQVQLHDASPELQGDLRVPVLYASTVPSHLKVWRLTAPNGLTAATAGSDPATVAAPSATGAVALSNKGVALWLGLDRFSADAGPHFAARSGYFWLNLPPQPPRGHDDPAAGVALDLHDLEVSDLPAALRKPIADIAIGATLMGPIPPGPPRQAAAAWRDAGGTIEIDHFAAHWGDIAITASGTLALDSELQPIGAFSGGIEGYDGLLAALVASGRIRESDAGLARLALTFLSKPGPDGRPRLSTSFTIQNGQMYLGPARIGPAPRIDWN